MIKFGIHCTLLATADSAFLTSYGLLSRFSTRGTWSP